MSAVAYEPNEKIQEEKRKPLNAEVIPFYLSKLDDIAKENNGHLALKRLTWADLFFTAMNGYMSFIAKQDLTANHENLKQVVENVHSIASIKEWVEKRPKTDA